MIALPIALTVLCIAFFITLGWSDPFYNYHDSVQWKRSFLVNALKEIPQAKPEKKALFLAADNFYGELETILEKGYHLVASDYEIHFDNQIIVDVTESYKDRVSVIDRIDREKDIPSVDLVIASFILPFHGPKDFPRVWNIIQTKLNPGGYFIGTFFDPSFKVFVRGQRKKMIFHTKDEVLKLFQGYTILKLEEVKKNTPNHKDFEHYYEVFAQKDF